MAKRQALSPSARKILQAERRKLDRLRKEGDSKRLDSAREEMARQAARLSEKMLLDKAGKSTTLALQRTLTALTQAVASSWGVTTPITIKSTLYSLKAWTDFKKVMVEYPWIQSLAKPPVEVLGSGQAATVDIDRSYIASAIIEIKAAVYHEIGHNLFTIPWPTFVNQFNTDSLEAFGQDAPLLDTLNEVTRHCWNLMEDQRQEARLVEDSPIIGTYLTALITKFFPMSVDLWMFVAGRRYLPDDLRNRARDMFDSEHGQGDTDTVEQLISRYMAATTVLDMGLALLAFKALTDDLGVSEHDVAKGTHHTNFSEREEGTAPSPEDLAKNSASRSTKASDTEASDTEDTDQGEASADAESLDSGDSDAPGAGSRGTSQDAPWKTLRGIVEDCAKEAVKQLSQNHDVQAEVSAVVEAFDDIMADPLPRLEIRGAGVELARPAWVAKGDALAADMERVFESRTADCAPMWQFRTTRGVVDSFAYRTREPGTREFYRTYDDRGDYGRSLAVSVLLDISTSMAGLDEPLSVGGYGIAKACRALDIPVNVMTFDSSSALLYGAEDRELEMAHLVPRGGTYPDDALQSLDQQTYGKAQHLVFILTDGMWNESSLVELRRIHSTNVNRHTFLLGLGMSEYYMNTFTNYGVAEALCIDDISEMPPFVQNTIGHYLG